MADAMEDHKGTASIGGWIISNLRFFDVAYILTGNIEELASLVKCTDETFSTDGTEIRAEKTNLITNSVLPVTTKLTVTGKRT